VCICIILVFKKNRQALLSLSLIFATHLAFYFTVAIWIGPIWNTVCPLVVSFSCITLLLTSGMDPGIIPRCPQSPLIDHMPDQVKIQINYCSTCHIVRPPRAKHCRQCDSCIKGVCVFNLGFLYVCSNRESVCVCVCLFFSLSLSLSLIKAFDHHCPWTGNCIGARNYRVFLLFITSTLVSSMLAAWGCIVFISEFDSLIQGQDLHPLTVAVSSGDASVGGRKPTAFDATTALVLLLWTLLAGGYLFSLTAFHLMLICMGKTTNEYLKTNDFATLRACAPAAFVNNMVNVCCDEVCVIGDSIHLYPKYEMSIITPNPLPPSFFFAFFSFQDTSEFHSSDA
jgi:hypothetical protein